MRDACGRRYDNRINCTLEASARILLTESVSSALVRIDDQRPAPMIAVPRPEGVMTLGQAAGFAPIRIDCNSDGALESSVIRRPVAAA